MSLMVVVLVQGDPVGGSITNISTTTRTTSPDNRSDEGGTITIMNVDATQQNFAWKAYVGNISGTLVLDDSNGRSIYGWSLTTLTGEILATRTSSPVWTTLSCAAQSVMAAENTVLNMGGTDIDNINNTFNETAHQAFSIAGNTMNQNTCPSAATYVNDTSQTASSTALYQEILINDSSSNLIFVGELESNLQGFDNSTYDFQLIVPDNDAASNQTQYYFYVELDS